MVLTRRNNTSGSNGAPMALVTGGCGFLGRHLVEQLVSGGTYSVRVFDLRAPKEGEGLPGVEYVAGDLRRSEDVAAACQGERRGCCKGWGCKCPRSFYCIVFF
jgi:NAD(P)-dependent dehydrogenase (short-subunit alcohol dehydrogenase family)